MSDNKDKEKEKDKMKKKDVGIQTDPPSIDDDDYDEEDFDTDVTETEEEDDYITSESDEEDEIYESDEEDDADEDEAMQPTPFLIMVNASPRGPMRLRSQCPPPPNPRKRVRCAEDDHIVNSYTRDEHEFFTSKTPDEQQALIQLEHKVRSVHTPATKIPMRFKILESNIDAATKTIILAKLEQHQRMHEGSGEYFKLRNWLQAVDRLPLGKYHQLPIQPTDPIDKVANFLQGVRKSLDDTVYGHQEAKDQIMRIFAQWISNPKSRGHCIGIQGAMGVGKTQLIKEGLCKALGLPFGFIALGGATDGSFLEGHGFTYEGSTYGKISEVLMKTKVMNPIFFFDELDKVSQTRRGEEIAGILTHMTDSTQNERFNDRYFGEIDMDLSKALMVFTYNDEFLINPILKDRMITIHVKGYSTKEKLCIAKEYLIPSILQQYNLSATDIVYTDEVLENIISRIPPEEGVRNLKRAIESIASWLNMQKFIPEKGGAPVAFPVTVVEEHVKKYIKRNDAMDISRSIQNAMYM